jgi:RimJ/RimL family protein N-acetyltransferase
VVIEGRGITLRPWRPDDVPFVYDSCQDPEIQRWTTVPRPYSATHAVQFVAHTAAARTQGTLYAFAVTNTDTGELLGAIDLRDVTDGQGLIGYWLAPECRGRGVATAALDALAAWAFAEMGLREVRVRIASTNGASLRVAERAGFRFIASDGIACPDGDTEVPGFLLGRRAPA